ncbi:MAG: Omp28-related outer membrane protein, partial [Bacteroidia bacterium]
MKRNLTMVLGSLLFAGMTSAQQWVETTAQNKKVVLEEFTGVQCTWCPAGHLLGKQMKEANPDDVILINIHEGSFAVPHTNGGIDLRTTDGSAIGTAASSRTVGWPSGSVNRASSPWAKSRTTWEASGNTVRSQASPVNVYTKSFFNRDSSKLTTEVEVYYTDDPGASSHKLSVMLLENNILGPQTGASKNPDNIVGDLYKHNHVFRQMISPGGAFGETISSPVKGTYVYKKYETQIPSSLKGVPVTFFNLEVVAFVSEGNN